MARKTEDRPQRVSAQFAVVRAALIHIMAGENTPTQEIAEALGVNRSYVIRLQELPTKPGTAAERKIAKLAAGYESKLARMGFGFIFKEGLVTTLAGGDRSTLANRGGRPVGRKTGVPFEAAPKPVPAKPKAPAKGEKAPTKAAKPKAPAKAPAKAASKPKAAKPAKAPVKPAKAASAPQAGRARVSDTEQARRDAEGIARRKAKAAKAKADAASPTLPLDLPEAEPATEATVPTVDEMMNAKEAA